MARVISLANQKGGVGKTTTTINLGAALAERGFRVLLVDFDPQGALSVGVGVNSPDLDLTVYNALLDRSADPAAIVCKTTTDGLELLPANIDLSAAEVVLVSEVAREQALKRVLGKLKDGYDFVLIDCPPSLGLLTINALTASDSVIIPLECEFFALRGMSLLIDTIEKVRDRLNPDLELQGIIPTMFDSRTLHGREVLDRVRDKFGAKLFRSVITRTIRFAEAPVAGLPILSYASDSKGAQAYRSLAKEVLGIDDQESELAGSGRAVPGHFDFGVPGPQPRDPAGNAATDGTGRGGPDGADGAGVPDHDDTQPALFESPRSADAGPTGPDAGGVGTDAGSPAGDSPGFGSQAPSAEDGERTDPPRGEGDLLLRP